MDENVNRVYINPNFKRTSNIATTALNTISSRNYMHVNPHFSRHLPNEQNVNRKIYVNPNFFKSNYISETVSSTSSCQDQLMLYNNLGLENIKYVNKTYSSPDKTMNENSKINNNNFSFPTSKSKYRLIRNNENNILEKNHRANETCTIKISKYKSIPMHNFKTNLHIIESEARNKQKQPNTNVDTPLQKYVNKSCFKLIRNSLVSVKSASNKLSHSLITNSQKIKRTNDLRSQTKLRKVSNSLRKKTNIPCRLFTKYGKCIRNLSGTCEFLHDKKHISLCRKFIKGICHDKSCLLSHELSSNKMPTCYFYLKGMCMKDDCPYLHVKLSEKSKICLDFLQGYCDKGDTCPHRHIKPRLNKIIERKLSDKNIKKASPNKIVKLNVPRVIKSNLFKIPQPMETKETNNCKKDQEKCVSECRYYKEDLQNEVKIEEIVKPSRCKLGILPSYIKL